MTWTVVTILVVAVGMVSGQDGVVPASPSGAPANPRGAPLSLALQRDGQKVVAIMHNSQHTPDEAGTHSSDFEAENGIKFQFSGSEGVEGGANMAGVYSYIMEDGNVAEVTYVADENGYQPQSSLLPVAPAFPHPIPQFVLDQIAFAQEEEQARAQEQARGKQGGNFNRETSNDV